MCNSTHDPHFGFHLLVYDTVLHETSLLELFGSVRNSFGFCRHFVDNRERALTNRPYSVVLVSTLPFLDTPRY
jgi:hypothetical protein